MTSDDPVMEPAGFDDFCTLATRLYDELGEITGGPLHVELEDHNTEFLVGASATATRSRMEAALAAIEAGAPIVGCEPVPGRIDDRAHAQHLVEWYSGNREALRVSIAILQITEHWSEEQAEAAYAVWHWRRGETPCGCQEWTGFARVSS